jgi:hypothetical protein
LLTAKKGTRSADRETMPITLETRNFDRQKIT